MLNEITGTIIVVSDRVVSGEREDRGGPLAQSLLAEDGIIAPVTVVEEGIDAVSQELAHARSAGVRVILTLGGTGLGPRNLTPEATSPHITVALNGLSTQVLVEGLKHSTQAGLSRGLIGLTGRGPTDSLIINAASSLGAIRDTLSVICPVLPSIFERIDRA